MGYKIQQVQVYDVEISEISEISGKILAFGITFFRSHAETRQDILICSKKSASPRLFGRPNLEKKLIHHQDAGTGNGFECVSTLVEATS